MIKKLPPVLRNRYALVFIGLLLYITFIDAHDVITQIRHKYRLHQIEKEIDYLQSRIEETHTQRDELNTNKEALEKFAREQYRMKRVNEDVFVVIYE